MIKKLNWLLMISFIFFTKISIAQSDSLLKYIPNKRNIVANTIEGSWSNDDIDYVLTYELDTGILSVISKDYYSVFKDYKIYFVGTIKTEKKAISQNDNSNISPFIIIERDGNMEMVLFLLTIEKITEYVMTSIFVILEETKEEDILYLGDMYYQGYREKLSTLYRAQNKK
jgi:hypothetical protein